MTTKHESERKLATTKPVCQSLDTKYSSVKDLVKSSTSPSSRCSESSHTTTIISDSIDDMSDSDIFNECISSNSDEADSKGRYEELYTQRTLGVENTPSFIYENEVLEKNDFRILHTVSPITFYTCDMINTDIDQPSTSCPVNQETQESNFGNRQTFSISNEDASLVTANSQKNTMEMKDETRTLPRKVRRIFVCCF